MYDDTPSVGCRLTGSEKQVTWAVNIRRDMSSEITRLRHLLLNPALVNLVAVRRASNAGLDVVDQIKKDLAVGVEILDAAEIAISAATDARWFIDRRGAIPPDWMDRKAQCKLERRLGVHIFATWESIKW